MKPTPFIKWVGGKRQLLKEILPRIPHDCTTYIEPFIGGGAVMWNINTQQYSKIIINDYNSELVNCYRVIQQSPEKLIQELDKHINDKQYYLELRNLDRNSDFTQMCSIFRASRFIFLNKTGFNGLYRVNSNNQMNVPYGKNPTATIYEIDNIFACSKHLQNIVILNGSFEHIKEHITDNTFVYLDPPYFPISQTADFTTYTDIGFGYNQQMQLKELCDFIDSKKCKFIQSNSHSPIAFDMYSKYNIVEVYANRAINCDAAGRSKMKEILVINYDTNYDKERYCLDKFSLLF